MMRQLNVVIIKPSKYEKDGSVLRFWKGFMPNATGPYIASMTPARRDDMIIRTFVIDEAVYTDLDYLRLISAPDTPTLAALVGIQSHQLHRAADLLALAHISGCMTVAGGPHVSTCDTSMLQGKGISFALSEAEVVWEEILSDAMSGELKSVYGEHQRWADTLAHAPVLKPPSKQELRRYIVALQGQYPVRGCPFLCSYCSIIKIAGRRERSQPVETTLSSLIAAKNAGVKLVIFVSDNLNKWPELPVLLEAMIRERLGIKWICQCDVQIGKKPDLLDQMHRAGCYQIFIGIESFDRDTLLAAHKNQNHPERYAEIVQLCRQNKIVAHFSNIIGFPTDTTKRILWQLEMLKQMGPGNISAYILTPIPGTEDYHRFLAEGLITESNLDRFDTQSLTWRHPTLSAQELENLLYRFYAEFYTPRRFFSDLKLIPWTAGFGRGLQQAYQTLGMSLFIRWCAAHHQHPLSGGIRRRQIDRMDDYLHLRRKIFGYELFPLPDNLSLSAREEELNRKVNTRAHTVPH